MITRIVDGLFIALGAAARLYPDLVEAKFRTDDDTRRAIAGYTVEPTEAQKARAEAYLRAERKREAEQAASGEG